MLVHLKKYLVRTYLKQRDEINIFLIGLFKPDELSRPDKKSCNDNFLSFKKLSLSYFSLLLQD